jgi:hypothetical protein
MRVSFNDYGSPGFSGSACFNLAAARRLASQLIVLRPPSSL